LPATGFLPKELMKDPTSHELIARALRRELTAAEQQNFERILRQDGEFRAEWEIEQSLEKALDNLPNAPVSSNFTSLVLQAALREEPREAVTGRNWFQMAYAKLAAGLAFVAVVSLVLVQNRESAKRQDLAQTVNAFHQVASAVTADQNPPTEVFQNFEAIQRLSLPAESELDMELLVALQK
jgi:hypothetical protein